LKLTYDSLDNRHCERETDMTPAQLDEAAVVVNMLRRMDLGQSSNVVQALMDEAMRPKPKLYVWEGVLEDYTCGMVVVLAASDEQATTAITDEYWATNLDGLKLDNVTPEIIDLNDVKEAKHWHVYGGG
jgi:hypothetical protein